MSFWGFTPRKQMRRKWRITIGSLYVSFGIGAHCLYSHSISKNSTTWALISAKRPGEYNLLTCPGQRARFYGTHISLSPYQRLSTDSILLINTFVRKLYFGGGRGEFCLLFVLALKRLLEKYLNLLEYSIFLFELLSISLISSILFGTRFVLTNPLSGYQPF